MRQQWERIRDLWDTGNFWIRLAVVLILVWPVLFTLAVLGGVRGDMAVALVLMPAGALILLLLVIPPMLLVLLATVPFPFPSRKERAGPQGEKREQAFRKALKFLTLIAGIETAIGVYVAGVPVWNDPGLILWLLAITVVFVLLWLGGVRHKWLTLSFVVAILAITATFFLGGREESPGRATGAVGQIRIPGIQAPRFGPAEEFTVKAGEEVFTALVGPGTKHRIQADNPWVALSRDDQNGIYKRRDGNYKPYDRPSGSSIWDGGAPESPLLVRGGKNGTTIRFERVK